MVEAYHLKLFCCEIEQIERLIEVGTELSPSLFDSIPLEIIGLLYFYYLDEYQNAGPRLAEMPPAEVQLQWTGADGHALMAQCVREDHDKCI